MRRSLISAGAIAFTLWAVSFAVSQCLFPTLSKELRDDFERVASQATRSHLDQTQQALLMQQLERIAGETKSGDRSEEECKQVLDGIRLLLVEYGLTEGLVKRYIENSTLDDNEQASLENTLRRYAQAMLHGKIDAHTAVVIEDRAREAAPDGSLQFRKSLEHGELLGMIQAMNEAADDADIEGRVAPIDVCERVTSLVDESQ